MSRLLARTADRLLWGGRYLERAEDTARAVRAYNNLVVDYDSPELLSWEPLAALAGTHTGLAIAPDSTGEREVLALMVADRANPSSIVATITAARSNLRTTREVLPREAWQTVNQLHQYVDAAAASAVDRNFRDRFLARVIEWCRQFDGTTESTMTRNSPYHVLRVGRLIERADMTTRVLGVAAAGILVSEGLTRGDRGRERAGDEVRWMHVLRSVSALQMYQQAVRGPIEGFEVVRFLLSFDPFPRSVQGCIDEIRLLVLALPNAERISPHIDAAEECLAAAKPEMSSDGARLDLAMEQLQRALAELGETIHDTYVGSVL